MYPSQKPLLSIIIPFYNVDQWLLERCIKSIIDQPVNNMDYEVIIVDDGSIVFPHDTIALFPQKNIRYFHQENQGSGGARNSGMQISNGKYILFVDSDDYLFENTLPHCFEILKSNDLDLLGFRYRTVYKTEKESVSQKTVSLSAEMNGAEYMFNHNVFGCVWLFIFKKSLALENNISFTPRIYHEDEEFIAKLYFYAQKVIMSKILVYAYYQRNDSIINKKGNKHLQKRFDDFTGVIKRLYEFKESNRATSSDLQQKGIERKILLLTGDLVISMARRFCSISYIRKQLKELRKYGLYPLPYRNYSYKYKILRYLVNYKCGICLLYPVEFFRVKLKQ